MLSQTCNRQSSFSCWGVAGIIGVQDKIYDPALDVRIIGVSD